MSDIVREKLEDYFASMNPISNRMMADIVSSRQECANAWDTLPYEERSEIEWRYLVKDIVIKKYETLSLTKDDTDSFPVLRTRPGEKIIVDEDPNSSRTGGCVWRDEHSAPFRWETQSQLELNIENDDSESEKSGSLEKKLAKSTESVKSEARKDDDVKKSLLVKRPEVPPPPVPPHAVSPIPPQAESPPKYLFKDDTPIYAKVVKRKSASAKTLVIGELKAHRKAMEEMKPAVPPRMSLELRGETDIRKYRTLPIDFEDIPKTGFDFLDNW